MSNQELIDFNVSDAAIAELSAQYMPLKINGVVDKDGAKVVNAARKVVKGYRIDVDKRRKELNADALEWQRKINAEAKRITLLLEPIENHLANEEKRIEDEIERIRREKERADADRLQVRVLKLSQLKFMFDGINYYSTYPDTFTKQRMHVAVLHLKQMNDDEFNEFFDNAKHYFDIEEKVIAEQKAQEDADRKALAEERARLEAIAKEQAAKEAALKQEAERIESLKLYEESKQAVINSEIECKTNGCEAPAHQRPKIVITQDHVKMEDREWRKDIMFWEGFDAAIDLVLNVFDNVDSNRLPSIETIRDEIVNEVSLYKTHG
jgi:hypothetical protein